MRWVVAFGLACAGCDFRLPAAAIPPGEDATPPVCPVGVDPHDEDGDGTPDACDACPQLANAAAGDSDGDGIPDACDPHPTTDGDVLAMFETFAKAGPAPAGWQARGGGSQNDWNAGGDALRVSSGNDTHLIIFDTTTAHHTFDIGVDILAVTTAGFEFVTVLGDARSDVTQFKGCGIRVDTLSPAPDREIVHLDGAFFTSNIDQTDAPQPVGSYRMVVTIDQNRTVCSVPAGDNLHTLLATNTTHDNTFVGLRLNNATLAFRYAAIYRSP